MTSKRISRVWGTILLTITTGHCERSAAIQTRVVVATTVLLLTLGASASAKYSGGTGDPNDPYQIATAEDLMLLGESPKDYDKHFTLTADIDLDPNLPGRKVFDRAVIGIFAGDFDGNGHAISRLTGTGLFGRLESGAEVRDLGVVDVNVTGGSALVGTNEGVVAQCYSSGIVSGPGGLVGANCGEIVNCYSTSAVSGGSSVGGLVGANYVWRSRPGWPDGGLVTRCYSTGTVSGEENVGGLVGVSCGQISNCYSTSAVTGGACVGGLVGRNYESYDTLGVGPASVGGLVAQCYSIGAVSGSGENMGGLVGSNTGQTEEGIVSEGFWDTQTSGQAASAGGIGKTTSEMKTVSTFLEAGWDFIEEIENGIHEVWQMPEDGGYPVLAILNGYIPPELQGMGTAENPYLISDAKDMGAIIYYSPSSCYRLASSIDLSGIRWSTSVIPQFAGTFDGNGLTISHLTIEGCGNLGLFGKLDSGAQVKELGLLDVNIAGSGEIQGLSVGGIAGQNYEGSIVTSCSTGSVSGVSRVGGLVGTNYDSIIASSSSCSVNGESYVGGLVGHTSSKGSVVASYSTGSVSGTNWVGGLVGVNWASIIASSSSGSVTGEAYVGGLVGANYDSIATSYSSNSVNGLGSVGGLAGYNDWGSSITHCYSIGAVGGDHNVGGLVGYNSDGTVTQCFWDTQTSGQGTSAGGTGKTTAEMQTASTFLDAGWDFVGETANGTEDTWWILEGQDYPRLWWEPIISN